MAVVDFLFTPWTPVVLAVLYYLVPFFTTYSTLRSIPSPLSASLSNLWLIYQCRRGRRWQAVDEAHKKYGPLVRIQPDHVSIADTDAIPLIYGHGTGFLKAPYYDAFVSLHRGLFNTRDRAEHSRKRKIVSHTFSAKSITQFESYIQENLSTFVKQWDRLCDETAASDGYAHIDSLNWFNYLAFDIIGDLAFGAPFGMIEKGQDMAEIRKSPNAPITYAPAVEILNRRGEVSATLGCLPGLKPYAKYLPDPFFRNGLAAVEDLAGIAVARVSARLDAASKDQSSSSSSPDATTPRVDLLARLIEARDENGAPLSRAELTAEALTQLIAGSDTTSNTSCALLYHLLRTPHALSALQAELDAAIPDDIIVPAYEMVKSLPYLHNTISETLRIHSTSSLGLPRLVPPSGVTFQERFYPAGTVLSVPAYTLHHSAAIWGDDVEEFRPERWDQVSEAQKSAFIPFSTGPRSCVGRNVAEMELCLIVASVVRRYGFLLEEEGLETREGFLRKPLRCHIGVRRR